jgi:hypothetical protein
VGFDEETRELLDGRNFATVATVNPDGGPQTSLVWVARDGNTVLFSTTASRRKTRNLVRNPRVGLTAADERHGGGHDGDELDIGRERERGHVQDHVRHVLGVHGRLLTE